MKNVLDTYVSYFENVRTEFPARVNLHILLTTTRYRHQVMAVRAEKNAKRKKELKNRLPAFTPSGVFKGARASTLIKPTGLICIDIDKQDTKIVKMNSEKSEILLCF